MFAFVVAGRLFVPGDAAATAANVIGRESLFRVGFSANLLATACYLAATYLIYALLRPVNRDISLMATFFSLVGCAIGVVSSLLFFAPVVILGGSASANAFTLAQLQAQAHSFLTLSARANDIGLVFFALHVICVGYLIRRSNFLPQFLGILLTITGGCYLASSFAIFLALPFRAYLMPLVAVGGLLGEGALTFWLLLARLNVSRWKEQAYAQCGPCSLPLETAAS